MAMPICYWGLFQHSLHESRKKYWNVPPDLSCEKLIRFLTRFTLTLNNFTICSPTIAVCLESIVILIVHVLTLPRSNAPNIGADSTGATGNFAPVLTQEPGQTLRFALVPFMAVVWFFKWTLQLYLLNLTKRVKFAGSVGHPVTKMLSASGGLCPLTRGSAPGPRWGLCPQTHIIGSCSALAIVPPQPLTPSATYVRLNFAPVPQTESRRLWLQMQLFRLFCTHHCLKQSA